MESGRARLTTESNDGLQSRWMGLTSKLISVEESQRRGGLFGGVGVGEDVAPVLEVPLGLVMWLVIRLALKELSLELSLEMLRERTLFWMVDARLVTTSIRPSASATDVLRCRVSGVIDSAVDAVDGRVPGVTGSLESV